MWNVQLCIYVAKYLTKTLAFFFNVFMPLRYASVNCINIALEIKTYVRKKYVRYCGFSF